MSMIFRGEKGNVKGSYHFQFWSFSNFEVNQNHGCEQSMISLANETVTVSMYCSQSFGKAVENCTLV